MKSPRHSKRRRGSALLLAVVTVAVLSIALQLVYGELSTQLHALRQERSRAALQALTDAAIAGSLAALDADPLFAGLPEKPFGGGQIRSRVIVDPDGTRSLFALATLDGQSSGVHLRVALTEHGPSVRSLEPWRPPSDLLAVPSPGQSRGIAGPSGRG